MNNPETFILRCVVLASRPFSNTNKRVEKFFCYGKLHRLLSSVVRDRIWTIRKCMLTFVLNFCELVALEVIVSNKATTSTITIANWLIIILVALEVNKIFRVEQ